MRVLIRKKKVNGEDPLWLLDVIGPMGTWSWTAFGRGRIEDLDEILERVDENLDEIRLKTGSQPEEIMDELRAQIRWRVEVDRIVNDPGLSLMEKLERLRTYSTELQNMLVERLRDTVEIKLKMDALEREVEKKGVDLDQLIIKAAKVEDIAGAMVEILTMELGIEPVKTIHGRLFIYDRGELVEVETIIPEILALFNVHRLKLAGMLEEVLMSESMTVEDEKINPPGYILFNNTILNMKDWSLEQIPPVPTRDKLFNFKIDAEVNPELLEKLDELDLDYWEERIPKFLAHLRRLFPDDLNFNRSLEMLGSILIPSVIRRVFFVIGPPEVGKSTLKEALSTVLGPKVCRSVGLDQIVGPGGRFNMSLYGALVDVSTEGSGVLISAQGSTILNRLTGDATLAFEAKHKPMFTGKNYLKLIFLLNELPTFKKLDDAIVDRVYLIETTDQPVENPRPAEEVLAEILEEKDGVIAFLLWATHKLLGKDHILRWEYDSPLDDKREVLLKATNPVYQFLEVATTQGGRVERKVLYASYIAWARKEGRTQFSRTAFYSLMRTLYPEAKVKGERYFNGLTLLEAYKAEDEGQSRLVEEKS